MKKVKEPLPLKVCVVSYKEVPNGWIIEEFEDQTIDLRKLDMVIGGVVPYLFFKGKKTGLRINHRQDDLRDAWIGALNGEAYPDSLSKRLYSNDELEYLKDYYMNTLADNKAGRELKVDLTK